MVPVTLHHYALEEWQAEGAYRRPEKILNHTDCQCISKWAAAGSPAAAIDSIITDWDCVEDQIAAIEERGVEITVVEEPK